MSDTALQTHLTVLGHEKAPGHFLLADGSTVLSAPESVLLMAVAIANNTGCPDVGREIIDAFERAGLRSCSATEVNPW